MRTRTLELAPMARSMVDLGIKVACCVGVEAFEDEGCKCHNLQKPRQRSMDAVFWRWLALAFLELCYMLFRGWI